MSIHFFVDGVDEVLLWDRQVEAFHIHGDQNGLFFEA